MTTHQITIKTTAIAISNSHIYIACPFCPRGGRRHSKFSAIHKFGSNGNLNDRVEFRGGDCDTARFLKHPKGCPTSHTSVNFQIFIDSRTTRITSPSSSHSSVERLLAEVEGV